MSVTAGSITVITGGMFAGKSSELLRRLHLVQIAQKARKCKEPSHLLFKPKQDNRYAEAEVVSHNGVRSACHCISNIEEILAYPLAPYLFIDEGQFLEGNLAETCETLANRGARVVIALLDTDSKGKPFGAVGDVMAVSDEVIKLKAVCVVCGEPAGRSQRLTYAEGQVKVGGAKDYAARCRTCWTAV